MRFILLILGFILFSCSSTNKFETKSFTVIKVEEFDQFYRFKSVDENLNDTVNLISLKNQQLRKAGEVSSFNATSKIIAENQYNFKLQKIKTRVSTMEQLGQWVIIGKDTLWKGNSKQIAPKYFYSLNTLGIEISE